MARATRAELVAAGQWGSFYGCLAYVLASRLDSDHDTGSGMAAVSKEFSVVIDKALDDARRRPNELDEIRARRAAKHARATGHSS